MPTTTRGGATVEHGTKHHAADGLVVAQLRGRVRAAVGRRAGKRRRDDPAPPAPSPRPASTGRDRRDPSACRAARKKSVYISFVSPPSSSPISNARAPVAS